MDNRNGYPHQPEQYVELSQRELDQLQPTDNKTIHLEHFLKPTFIDPVLFAGRSPYRIGDSLGRPTSSHFARTILFRRR